MSMSGGEAEITIDAFLKATLPSILGRWDMPFEGGVVGVHAALLHTNEVLFWTYHDDLGDHQHDVELGADGKPILDADGKEKFITVQDGEWSLLNLSNGKQEIHKEVPQRNQFCVGQCLLGDGSVLVVGGDRDTPDNDRTVRIYNPTTRTWKSLQDLAVGRYYPTVVSCWGKLGFIVGGWEATKDKPHFRNETVQFLDAETGKTGVEKKFDADLKALPVDVPFPGVDFPLTYPFVFVLPHGKICVHVGYKTRILKLFTKKKSFEFDSATKLDSVFGESRNYPYQGTAVLLPLRPTDSPPYRARIMLIGGGAPDGGTAKDSCEILDVDSPNPKWTDAASMTNPRIMPDAVLLPDGTVLVVNGGESGGLQSEHPVLEAEIYHPDDNDPDGEGYWTTMAEMTVERLYHATALLLPDGRVLTAGTDRQWNARPHDKFPGSDYAHTQLEVFSPPYLFPGPRPTIRWSPDVANYGQAFEVATDEADDIRSAVLIRNGSCTHSFNSDQRFVELEIKKRKPPDYWLRWTTAFEIDWGVIFGRPGIGGYGLKPSKIPVPWLYSAGLVLQAPPDRFVAPEGYYMLFLVSNSGVPSEANFIRVG